MKLYKKLQKAFGGNAMYIDKIILNHLGILGEEELVLDLTEIDGEPVVIVKKSNLDIEELQRLLDEKRKKSNR